MTTIRAAAPPGVTLSRLDNGTPHVEAPDLAGLYWGMGYLHALDRGMQLSLMRVLGYGRAAELLDGSDEMVEVDRFFRRMNWAGNTGDEVAALDAETLALCEAYCAGINKRLVPKPPWELRLVGYRPPPWTLDDCVLLSRMAGYLTLAQSQAEVERLFVEMSQAGVDAARLAALFPEPNTLVPPELLAQVELSERLVPEALRWLSPAPRMMASNNWVVSGAKTRTGAAMLGNDPHLEINRLPNVWHVQSLSSPAHAWVGATMPGLPAPLIGRTRALSWGATYTFMDGVDSWVEHCRGTARRVGEDWVPFEVREELIARKGGAPVKVRYFETEGHGCLDREPNEEGECYRLSTRWAPATSGSRSLIAAVAMWSATTVEAGMAALGQLETAWNWVLADAEGHIGYQMSGLLPLRHPEWKGFCPAPGWDSAYDWRGFAPVDELPRVVDPPAGYIVTANDDLNHLGVRDPINMGMGDYRARRIAALLTQQDAHDQRSFAAIQTDLHSLQAEEFMAVLRPLLPSSGAAAEALRTWDLRYDLESRGATVFEAFYAALYREFFAGGEGGLSEAVVRHLQDATGVFIDFYGQCDRTLLDPDSAWLGGRTREAVFRAAFEAVASEVPAAWGSRNQITLTNMFFAGKLPRWLGFDRGPVPLPGGRATPQQGQVYTSAGRVTSFAPSLRVIADMSEARLWTALMGGPSDRRWSRWYTSGVAGWIANEYDPLDLGGSSSR